MDAKQQSELRDAITAHQEASADLTALERAIEKLTSARRDAADKFKEVTETTKRVFADAGVSAILFAGQLFNVDEGGRIEVLTVETIDALIDAQPVKL